MLFIPFLLTGCFKFTMDLEISSQDTISGTAVLGLAKELQALAQGESDVETTDAFSDLSGVTVTDFDDGTFVGQQYEFSGVPIEELTLSDDASDLNIRRDGDNLVVSGNLSFENEESGSSDESVIDLGDGFFDTADLRVSIKFPGDIVETNGDVNEATNTITWRPRYGEANELTAIVYAPRGIPLWVWWLVGGVVAVLAATGALLLLKRRSDSASKAGTLHQASVDNEEQVADSVRTPSEVSSRRSDRPLFSYRVKSGVFAKEAFLLRVFEEELDFVFIDKTGTPTTEQVVIPIQAVEDAAVLEGRAGLGVRLVHSGKVDLLPARKDDSNTLVALVKSLQLGKPSAQLPSSQTEKDATAIPTASGGSPAKTVASPPLRPSIADDIRQLHDLYKDGAISESEFGELKKKRIEKG